MTSSVHHKITREERRIARRSAAPKGAESKRRTFCDAHFLWQMVTCDLFAVANLLVTSTTLTSLFNIQYSLIFFFFTERTMW